MCGCLILTSLGIDCRPLFKRYEPHIAHEAAIQALPNAFFYTLCGAVVPTVP